MQVVAIVSLLFFQVTFHLHRLHSSAELFQSAVLFPPTERQVLLIVEQHSHVILPLLLVELENETAGEGGQPETVGVIDVVVFIAQAFLSGQAHDGEEVEKVDVVPAEDNHPFKLFLLLIYCRYGPVN